MSSLRETLKDLPRETLLLAALPALATLGEGGASALGLLTWHALVVLLVVATLLDRGTESRRSGAAAPLGAWGLFLLVALLGALRAPYTYAAWLNGVELAAVTAVFVLAVRRGPGLARIVVWPLAFAAAAQSLLALYQRFVDGQPRPAGTFLNPNHLGGFVVAILLLLAGEVLVAGDRRRIRVWALSLALPCAAALLVSGSRGALLAGLAGSAWCVASQWARFGPRRRVAVVVVGLLVAVPIGLRVGQRLRDTDPFLFHRLKIWRASTGPLQESPLWGSGPGQFALAASRFQFDDGHGPLRFDRAFRVSHSDVLRVPVEYGLPAALLLAFAVLAAVRESRRVRATKDAVASPGVAAALLAIGAQACVDNPSRWPALYLLATVLLGCLLSRRADVAVARPPRLVRGALAALLIPVFVVAEVGPTLAYVKVAGLPHGRLTDGEWSVLGLASTLNPIQPDLWLRRADHLVAGSSTLELQSYVEAREAAERAIRLSPRDSSYHWGLARVEGQACLRLFRTEASRERTYERLETAQQLSPTDARISLHAAEFGLAAGDPGYARRMAERALVLEPRAVSGHVLLARALLQKDPDDHQRAAELVDAAVRLAVEHASAADNGYARKLLTLNPERVADLRERAEQRERAAPSVPVVE